ncbi:MAG: DUF1854 domain-containing protein [Candidatus Latescibacterota bacterium]
MTSAEPEEVRRLTYEDHRLDPGEMAFRRSPRGGLILCLEGKEYPDVAVRLAFPMECEDRFVGLALADGTELGMLESMADLDPPSRRVLQEELDKVYFRPAVTRVLWITEEHGVLRGELETTSGTRLVEIRGWRENVRMLSGHRTIIEDVDGNRYLVRDWRALSQVTREILGL